MTYRSYSSYSNSMTRYHRDQLIASYDLWVEEYKSSNYEPYYFNWMFDYIPAAYRKQHMKAVAEATCKRLATKIVRKPNSSRWLHLRPKAFGCPDLHVRKNGRSAPRLTNVNDGLHFNAVVLVPPPNLLFGGKKQRDFLPPQSRLKVGLDEHFENEANYYRADQLSRIHVEPVKTGTMIDYTFKAFRAGKVSSDDILVF